MLPFFFTLGFSSASLKFMLYSTISPILMKQKKYDEPLFIMIHRISIFIVFYFFFDGAGWHPLHPPQLPPQLLQLFPDFLSFQTFRAARPTMHATITKTTNVPIFISTSSFFFSCLCFCFYSKVSII